MDIELKCKEFIEVEMEFDGGHDISHIERVVENAKRIAEKEGADLNVIVPACWLHDCVNVDKSTDQRSLGSKLSAEKAIEFLKSIKYPEKYLDKIYHAIEAHSYSANIKTETLEAEIVQDADRIDALGAIGISRCLMYSATKNVPLYDNKDPFAKDRVFEDGKGAIDHFYTKLSTLPKTMKTKTGKRIAMDRWFFMESFIHQLKKELK